MPHRWSQHILTLAASALLAMGLIVVCGWHVRVPALLQIYPGYIAMAYYTALCFIAVGVSLLFLRFGKMRACGWLAIFPLALGSLFLIEYATGWDLGIDTALMKWEGPSPQRLPGRMAPATAVGFFLAGFALLFASRRDDRSGRSTSVAMLAAVIGALALMAVVGYFTGLSGTYVWGNFAGMAVHTAAGMMVLAMGLLAFEWSRSKAPAFVDQRWLPAAAGVIVAVGTIILVQALQGQQLTELKYDTQRRAHDIQGRLFRLFESRTRAIDRMAQRWEMSDIFSEEAWEKDAFLHLKMERSFEGVVRFDVNGVEQWSLQVPLDGRAEKVRVNSAAYLRTQFQRAAETRTPLITDGVKLESGGWGVWMLMPVRSEGRLTGFLAASVPMESLLEKFIREGEAYGFDISIRDRGPMRFSNQVPEDKIYRVVRADIEAAIQDTTFYVQVHPTIDYVDKRKSPLPAIVTVVASLFGVTLVQAISKERRARRHALELKDAHAQLVREVDERERSDARFRAVAEAAHDAIVITDAEGKIRVWNRAAERIFGYTTAEAAGQSLSMVLPERLRAAHGAGLLRLAENGLSTVSGQAVEVVGLRKDGCEFPVELSLAQWTIGGERYFSGILRDITQRKQVEESLRESETRMRLFAEHAPAAVAMFDRNMCYLVASQRWMQDYHLTGQKIIGRSHYEVFPNIPEQWKKIHSRCLAGATEMAQEDRFERADGSVQWLSWRVQPWFDSKEEIGGIVMFTEDITQQMLTQAELKESELRFRGAAQASLDAFFVLSSVRENGGSITDFRYVDLNDRGAVMLGKRREDVVGQKLRTLASGEHATGLFTKYTTVVETRQPIEEEFAIETDGGNAQWLHHQVVPLGDGVAITTRDITDRKQLELSHAKARDEALAGARLKSEFLANMSHEIRTPMNGVLGMARLLMETKLASEQRRMGQVVLSSAENLLTIIDDILDFSKIEAGKMRVDPHGFDMVKLVRETSELLSAQARAKGLELVCDTGGVRSCGLVGDSGRIRQVLTNLMGNALKFTEQGRVRVKLKLEDEPGDKRRVFVEVSDSGIGMSPEVQRRLFQPFIQAEQGGRKYGGTGLGLAISRQLIDLMGGQIGCESKVDEGSVFWFNLELPLWMPEADEKMPQKQTTGTGGLRLLVAEDNLPNQMVVRLTLERMGHFVVIVENGREALNKLTQERFDAVLMDCQMPVMDGYEAVRTLREGRVPDADSTIPVIALTAYALPGDRARCLSAGMNEYVTKPLSAEALRQALARCGLDVGAPRAAVHTSSTPPIAGASTAVAIIDDKQLAKLAHLKAPGGEPLTTHLFELLVKEVPGRIAAMSAALAGQEQEPLMRAAHTLAGSSANLGAIALGAACRDLEETARRQDWLEAKACLTRLGMEWERLSAELARRFPALFS